MKRKLLAAAIGALSASVIGVQIGFMRALSVTRDFHFSYFVISIALLGFGASGTMLAVAARRRSGTETGWPSLGFIHAAAAGFVVGVPICLTLALRIPIDFQYLLLDAGQIINLLLFAVLSVVPFLCAGLTVGALLTRYADEGPLLYGANLIGSGLGAAGVLGLSAVVRPAGLAGAAGLPAALGLVLLIVALRRPAETHLSERAEVGERADAPGRIGALGAIGVMVAVAVSITGALVTPEPVVDQYKALAHFQTLAKQGAAERVYGDISPQGRIDIYDAASFHYSPFASPLEDAAPPDQFALLLDGRIVGGVLDIDAAAETRMFAAMPQSLAYRIRAPRRVLLLGATGGASVWLARFHGVEEITIVQPNRSLARLLDCWVGGPDVEIVPTDPRLFLESTTERFDLIHLVSAETMPATAGGLHSLNENYLLTVEGFEAMLRRLSNEGLVSVTRGTQTPPRDNIRVFATAAAVLRRGGYDPAEQLLQARNYLAATTLVASRPVQGEVVEAFEVHAAELLMDLEWLPGMRAPREQRNTVAGPEGESYSYYFAANRAILEGEEFLRDWVYRLEPPTDESPYFENFFRWRTLSRFRESYGQSWIRRLELGYVVLSVTAVVVLVLSILLIALPLAAQHRSGRSAGRGGTVGRASVIGYFATIGFGFMFVEIVAIQTFSQALGNHVFSATAVLAGLLVFSGAGSATQGRLVASPKRRIRVGSVVAAASILAFVAARRFVITSAASLGIVGRFVVVLALLLPVAYLLGWFFSSGLRMVSNRAPDLVPWAWASNGCASVVASPLAMMLAIEVGHTIVLAGAALLYASLGLYLRGRAFGSLPREAPTPTLARRRR